MDIEHVMGLIGRAAVNGRAYLASVGYDIETDELKSILYLVYARAKDVFIEKGADGKDMAKAEFKTYLIASFRHEIIRLRKEYLNERNMIVDGFNPDTIPDPRTEHAPEGGIMAGEILASLQGRNRVVASELIDPSQRVVDAAVSLRLARGRKRLTHSEIMDSLHAISQAHGLSLDMARYALNKVQEKSAFVLDIK